MSSDFSTLQYTYAPLNSASNCRLLRLELNSNDAGLKCELQEYQVDQAPPYICLSYCWGANRKIKDVINVKGKALFITDTVSMALRWIRAWKLTEQTTTSVLVWIDYLCINQTDTAERSSQVGHMKALYSQAELVLVYLGGQDQGSENLPELYQTLRMARDRFYEASKTAKNDAISWGIRDLSLREQNGIGLPPSDDAIWDTHRAFLRRPWFLRTWIIQEAVLARELFFVCGAWGSPGHLLTNGWHIMIAENILHLFSNTSLKDSLKQNAPETRAINQILHMLNMGMGEDVKKSSWLVWFESAKRDGLPD
jgi:hypothetical protein